MSQTSPATIPITICVLMSRVILAIVLLVAVAVAGADYLFGREAPGLSYRFEKVETGPLVNTVSASGTVRPVQSVAVTSQQLACQKTRWRGAISMWRAVPSTSRAAS